MLLNIKMKDEIIQYQENAERIILSIYLFCYFKMYIII